MTPSEQTAYFNSRAEAAAQKYGFKFVASARENLSIQEGKL
jgi:hypothetical protein